MRRAILLLAVLLLSASQSTLAQQPPPTYTGATPEQASQVAQGATDGWDAASKRGTAGWMVGGIASGVTLGLIGTGITYFVAGSSDTQAPVSERLMLSQRAPEYSQAFQAAYSDGLKSKRKKAALTGGLVGTATMLVLVLSAGGS
jgi:hypothetical protein